MLGGQVGEMAVWAGYSADWAEVRENSFQNKIRFFNL
jgi:hypothetical protein